MIKFAKKRIYLPDYWLKSNSVLSVSSHKSQQWVIGRLLLGHKGHFCDLCRYAICCTSRFSCLYSCSRIQMSRHVSRECCCFASEMFAYFCCCSFGFKHFSAAKLRMFCPFFDWCFSFCVYFFKRHARVHSDAKLYSCRHCWESFKWPETLKSRLLKSRNEGNWFTYHICEKKFSHNNDLKVHIQRHEGVKPYVCDKCQNCFCTAYELKRHLLVHSDFKGFCCGLCGKDFKRPISVKNHFRWCSVGVECESILWTYFNLSVCIFVK